MQERFKIWLCGMVQNCREDVDELTRDVYQYFDGLVFVDHLSTDGSKELLEARKGEGEIISIPWTRNHGTSYQTILNSQKILPFDFVLWVDSLERVNIDFAKYFREFCFSQLMKQNINSVFLYSKILCFRYFSDLLWTPWTPHCVLQNPKPNFVELSQCQGWEDEGKSRLNVRPLKRPQHHFVDHFCKYILEYKISNQMLCGREDNVREFQVQEEIRQKFLVYWNRTLGQALTVAAFKDYILKNELPYELRWFVNYNQYLNQFCRYYKLGHTVEQIVSDNEKKQLYEITEKEDKLYTKS